MKMPSDTRIRKQETTKKSKNYMNQRELAQLHMTTTGQMWQTIYGMPAPCSGWEWGKKETKDPTLISYTSG